MSDKGIVTGFAVIGILTIIGIVSNALYLVAAGVIFVLFASMFLAYPAKLAAMLFGILIVFTTSFLNTLSVYVGPFRITVDDILQLWIFFLWLGAFIDGEGKPVSTITGKLIISLISLSVIVFLVGILAGNKPESAALFIKTLLGYLFFFPAMWILKDKKSFKLLILTFIVSAFLAALWIFTKGLFGGEGVYLRETSGLRVSSQEVNVVVVGLFLVAISLWKKYSKIPVLIVITSVLIMGASILLAQSRALWLAIFVGALVAFVADLGYVDKKGFKLGKLLSKILLLVIFTAGSIAFVSVLGLLSLGDVAARSGGADGGFGGDISLWARYLSWWEIIKTVSASPLNLVFGMGFGYEITYFRPDLLMQVSIPYVDGSFFQMLLNTGISGVVILALLYANGIVGSFRVALRGSDPRTRIFALWLTASFTALTVAALTGSLITNYRFTCLWAFMFAVLETIRKK